MTTAEIIMSAIVSSELIVFCILGLYFFFKFASPHYIKQKVRRLEEESRKQRLEIKNKRKLIKYLSKDSYVLNCQLEDSQECIQQLQEELDDYKKQLEELQNVEET